VVPFSSVCINPAALQLVFIWMLLLPEGHVGEVWLPSKKQSSLGNRGALDRKIVSFFVDSFSRL
jgi:hypothetical protein